MNRIAVIGLGAMGGPMAHRLLSSGCEVNVWNRSPDRTTALAGLGATVGSTPADAARRAQAVIVMVSTPEAVHAVSEGTLGVLAGVQPGAVVLQMSTVSPSTVTELAERLPQGVGLLDAPVLGSVAEAASGRLRILVGGPQALVERTTPLLELLGAPVHVGALGAGTAAKLTANNVLFGVLGVLGESLALGAAMGLAPEVLHGTLALTPLATQSERRRPSIEAGDYPARFALALARKDADLIASAAHDAGLELGLSAAAGRWLADAEADGRGHQDYSAVLAQILQHAKRETQL